jgi:Family of unknown function (DUF6529)
MTTDSELTPAPGSAASHAKLLVPIAIGALVSLTIGIYAKAHTPTGIAVNVAGFSSLFAVKSWLATVAATFAIVQLVSALSMYGKLGRSPSWIGGLHRWSGRIAFAFTIPVMVHCVYALGFSDLDTRTLIHSLLGCLFFGVFTIKMLVLTKRGLAGWVLPLFGGLVFTILIGLWLTSALVFFQTNGLSF